MAIIEDHDGAPYPEAVQVLWDQLRLVLHPDDVPDFQEYVIDAVESVKNFHVATG